MENVVVKASTGSCNGGTCSLGDLAPGQTGTMSVGGTPTETGTLLWRVRVSSGTAYQSKDGYIPVSPRIADLVLTATPPPATVKSGKELTFSFAVRNKGPDVANGSRLTFHAPGPHLSQVRFAVNGTPVSCPNGTCGLGNLDPGGYARVTLTAIPTEIGHLNWVGSATSAIADPKPANSAASGKVSVGPQLADLLAGVYVNGSGVGSAGAHRWVAHAGQQVIFHLSVRNTGPDTAVDVRLKWDAVGVHFEDVHITNQ